MQQIIKGIYNMKKTIEDIKKQMIMSQDKSGLSLISMIENFVKKENSTIGQAITYFLKDKTITGYKKNILNLLRITYPYDGEITNIKNNKIYSNNILQNTQTEYNSNKLDNKKLTDEKTNNIEPINNETAVFSVYQQTIDNNLEKINKSKKIIKQDKKKDTL